METILIIEDDAKLASLLSTYLSKYVTFGMFLLQWFDWIIPESITV